MIGWIKAQWRQLPHQLQAFLTAFGAGAFTTIMSHMTAGTTCMTLACIEKRFPEVLSAGAAAAMAFYMKPNRNPEPQQQAPAEVQKGPVQ